MHISNGKGNEACCVFIDEGFNYGYDLAHKGFLEYGFCVGFHQRRILIQFDVKQAGRLPVCKPRRLLYLQ